MLNLFGYDNSNTMYVTSASGMLKVNISYDSMLDCSLYEFDYWIARANKLVEEEEEKQKERE